MFNADRYNSVESNNMKIEHVNIKADHNTSVNENGKEDIQVNANYNNVLSNFDVL